MYVFKGCRLLTHIREQDSDTHLKVVLTVCLALATLMQCVGHMGLYEPYNNIDNDCHWRNGISKSGVLFTCPVLWSIRRSRYFTTPAKYHGSFGITQIIDAVMAAHAFAVKFIYYMFVTCKLLFNILLIWKPNVSIWVLNQCRSDWLLFWGILRAVSSFTEESYLINCIRQPYSPSYVECTVLLSAL